MAVATPTRKTTPMLGNRNSRRLQLILTYALLIGITLLVVLPFLWMLSTSFKPKSQWFLREIYWIPRTFTLENYTKILNNRALPMERWFFNSVGVATVTTALVLTADAFAAYAYARLEFPGRKLLFGLLLATLFLPGVMFLVPNFLTVARLGLLNTYPAVILPAIAGVFGVFFMRQFFESLPRELEEAASIDGANTFQTFIHIILPLAKPALATLGILTFLGSWNDFLWPLLVLKDRTLLTLPPGLRTLQGAFTSEYGQMMAGAAIAAVPVLLLYLFMQRYIVESVTSSAVKG